MAAGDKLYDAYESEIKPLFKLYEVDSLVELIRAQEILVGELKERVEVLEQEVFYKR